MVICRLKAIFEIGLFFNYISSPKISLTYFNEIWSYFTIFTHSNKLMVYIAYMAYLVFMASM
jgi:hypothetical protein